jgi:hypothetical protein
MGNDGSLSNLVHDINGKCANLKSAAALLRDAPSKGELELLGMMSKQARSLADAIAAYEARRRGERAE